MKNRIIKAASGSIIVVNRYGADDYSAWWTDADHLDDDAFGYSVRGSLSDIMQEMKDDLQKMSTACARFADIPFSGDAIAIHNGSVIWTNRESGDCPPDIAMMIVANTYVVDNLIVFDLKEE